MIFLTQLWIPILASAVLVFIASTLIHMLFKWHNSDYRKLDNEDAVRATVRAGNVTPGQYVFPHCVEMKDRQSSDFMKKFVEGPVGSVTIMKNGPPKMGVTLALWFALILAVAVVAAYVAANSLPAGASFGQVARLVGAIVFLAYAVGSVTNGVWMGRQWSAVAKDVLDAAIYAAITASVFGWLWAAR